ncbi:hypothetical protein NYE40_23860 [Paenibacillus sp. FSL W8-1187]|uniref:hypothetical protein n=1 Tax=Paenibacillus sp. FSL W8-1187 TaxID=2975339 RepID=UPI0030DAE72E
MDENFREVYKQLQTSQDKYVYFILAATLASIAFAIKQSQALPLKMSQIPLALSVVCWGISFFLGCRNREYYNSTLYANSELLRIQSGKLPHPEYGNHPNYILAASEGILAAIQKNSNKVSNLGRNQMRMFLLGALFYTSWHIIEMYMRSK